MSDACNPSAALARQDQEHHARENQGGERTGCAHPGALKHSILCTAQALMRWRISPAKPPDASHCVPGEIFSKGGVRRKRAKSGDIFFMNQLYPIDTKGLYIGLRQAKSKLPREEGSRNRCNSQKRSTVAGQTLRYENRRKCSQMMRNSGISVLACSTHKEVETESVTNTPQCSDRNYSK